MFDNFVVRFISIWSVRQRTSDLCLVSCIIGPESVFPFRQKFHCLPRENWCKSIRDTSSFPQIMLIVSQVSFFENSLSWTTSGFVWILFCHALIGSLSTHVFEPRTATGSELFSLVTCFHRATFTLLSIFSPLEMISTKIWETPLSWHVKCSLPVAVRVSKTRVLKLPNTCSRHRQTQRWRYFGVFDDLEESWNKKRKRKI